LYRDYFNRRIVEDCPNCGKPNSARIGSTSWGHDYMCCSEACGIRLGKRIENGMVNLPKYRDRFSQMLFGSTDEDNQINNLRLRIKILEGQLKSNRIKPMKTRI
jgi:hypothetical protein